MERNFSFDDAKNLIHRHKRLQARLIDFMNADKRYMDMVSDISGRYITTEVLKELRNIPVEELNRDKLGIRVKSLRQNGFSTYEDIFAASVHGLGLVVQPDAPDLQGRGLLLHASQLGVPPELAAHPGHHLHRVERLGNVIVRPQVQPQHLVRILAFCRDEDHRHIAGPPQLDGGGYAVQPRHHNIHQHQVDLFLFHTGQGFLAVVCLFHLVALRLEVDLQRGYDIPVIIANQYFIHASLLPLLRPASYYHVLL